MKLDSVLIVIGLSNLLQVMNINIASALAVLAEGWNKSENGQILWQNDCGFHGESGELLRELTAEE